MFTPRNRASRAACNAFSHDRWTTYPVAPVVSRNVANRPVPSASTDSGRLGSCHSGPVFPSLSSFCCNCATSSAFSQWAVNDAQLARQSHRLIHFRVVNAKEILVRKENLEGRSSIGHHLAQLAWRFFHKFCYRHVKGIIAGALPFRLLFPEFVTLQRVVIAVRTAHFNVGSCSTD